MLDLSWIPHLSSLKTLDMTSVDLSSVKDWAHKANMLPNLRILSFPGCGLNSTVAKLSHFNLINLEVLDLSGNPFHSALQH